MLDKIFKSKDKIWKLLSKKKELKEEQNILILKASLPITLICSALTFLFYGFNPITIMIAPTCYMMIPTCFVMFIDAYFPLYINRKLKKRIKENKWERHFSLNQVFNNKKLEEVLDEMKILENDFSQIFTNIFSSGSSSVENLLEVMILANYNLKEDSSMKFLTDYISEIKQNIEHSSNSTVVYKLIEKRLENISEKDFFEEKTEIINLIKNNISSVNNRSELASLMKSNLERFNCELELDKAFEEIEMTKSIKLKIIKSTKNEFVLKSI